MQWGDKATCKVLAERCVVDGVSQDPSLLCTDTKEKRLYCTSGRRDAGPCLIRGLGILDPYFLYFPRAAIGELFGQRRVARRHSWVDPLGTFPLL